MFVLNHCFKNAWSKLMSLSIVPEENNKLENWLFIDLISWNIFKIYIHIKIVYRETIYFHQFQFIPIYLLCHYFLPKKIWYLFLLSKHLQVIFSLISRYIVIFLAPTSTCKDCRSRGFSWNSLVCYATRLREDSVGANLQICIMFLSDITPLSCRGPRKTGIPVLNKF